MTPITHTTPLRSARTCDVLVVGGGPAGLSTAIEATRNGAAVLVADKRPDTSSHPRSLALGTRTMEILRSWGIDRAVRAAGAGIVLSAVRGPSLRGPHTTYDTGYPTPREALAVSPAAPVCCAQDRLEPLLVAAARRAGADVRFGTEVSRVTVDDGGVRAVLTDRATGSQRTVSARYLVGADGARSAVRGALGIDVEWLGTMGPHAQVVFRADLRLPGPAHALHVVEHPDAAGLVFNFGSGRWGYARPLAPGERAADITPARWVALLRAASGLPALDPQLLDATGFTLDAELATASRAGRGFLVGDAAHRTTPVGAVGLNTAVHDGHNLGWKLGWVIRGLAGPALLDSYETERRPVGERVARRSLVGGRHWTDGLIGDLGTTYRSGVIASDGSPPGCLHPALATGAPGERAPHRWLGRGRERRSTLDLFPGRLTLLVGPGGAAWRRAAAHVDVPIAVEPGGPDAPTDGATLVRPDGYVAWRCRTAHADPVAALAAAVDLALGRVEAAGAVEDAS